MQVYMNARNNNPLKQGFQNYSMRIICGTQASGTKPSILDEVELNKSFQGLKNTFFYAIEKTNSSRINIFFSVNFRNSDSIS